MYKPYSGVDYTMPTSHWNIKCFSYFLKDLFSCLAPTMPSKNHLFSLLRNASLICVYSSLVLLTSRDFFAEALFRLFSSSRFTGCLLFSASKLICPCLGSYGISSNVFKVPSPLYRAPRFVGNTPRSFGSSEQL